MLAGRIILNIPSELFGKYNAFAHSMLDRRRGMNCLKVEGLCISVLQNELCTLSVEYARCQGIIIEIHCQTVPFVRRFDNSLSSTSVPRFRQGRTQLQCIFSIILKLFMFTRHSKYNCQNVLIRQKSPNKEIENK